MAKFNLFKTALAVAAALGATAAFGADVTADAYVTKHYGEQRFKVGTKETEQHSRKFDAIAAVYGEVDQERLSKLPAKRRVGSALNREQKFSHMIKMYGKPGTQNVIKKDNNGVYLLRTYLMTGKPWDNIPMPDHSQLGRTSIKQLGDLDAWYGDWAEVAPNAKPSSDNFNNYAAFYGGTGITNNLPTSGTAKYAVEGINHYAAENAPLLKGTLTADFGNRTLKGTIARPDLSIGVDAKIYSVAMSSSFVGKAVANNSVAGNTRGLFFGDKGAALAGVAEFKNSPNLNTAFGGTKQ